MCQKLAAENKTEICFHSSSAQWLDLTFSCTDKVCESHLRLVDLLWQMHWLCSKTFSCGSSQVWGCGPWKSNMYEQDNAWPWPRFVSCLARNVNANAGEGCTTEQATWNTVTVLFASLACSSILCCAIISPIYSNKRISVIKRMWTGALGRKKIRL